jgi:hypothetical protein
MAGIGPAHDDSQDIIVTIDDDDDTTHYDPQTNTIETRTPDGGVIIQLDAYRQNPFGANQDADADNADLERFYRNLAEEIGDMELPSIAETLMQQIDADDQSRQGYLEVRARAIRLLGTKLEEPRSTVGDSSAPMEGMSNVHSPLMVDAILRSWANSQKELLPATGPVKIANLGTSEAESDDDLAEALQADMNWYFTKGIPEYRADTSQMLLWGTHAGGSGFKKAYRCPMREKPVSESVEPQDLIVSDTTKDLRACARITHVITMRPSLLKRMILSGAYRETATLTQPQPSPNVVAMTIAGVQGTMPRPPDRPEDQPYTLYETQCELDLARYAPGKFKGKGIPLPYLVTIDKDSREILAIRRDWKPGDKNCKRRQMYVKYPYIPGPGFYGTGLFNLLGNSTAAMTAAWREALDAGMFASFPSWLVAKGLVRQNTSDMRAAPGGGVVVDTNGMKIGEAIMQMPFHDVTPGLMAMIDKITQQAQRVGGSVEIPTGEGMQNMPVGTMLAYIEQATQIMLAVHMGMHDAQSEEIQIIVELFRDNPEDFWRENDEARTQWDADLLVKALSDYKLVPVSDPNVPSHVHRIMKAWGLTQLFNIPEFKPLLNAKRALIRVLRAMKEDPDDLVMDPPPPPPMPVDLKGQAAIMDAKTKQEKVSVDAQKAQTSEQTKLAALAVQKQIADTNLKKELVIHAHDADQAAHERGLAVASHNLAVQDSAHQQAMDIVESSKPDVPTAGETAST